MYKRLTKNNAAILASLVTLLALTAAFVLTPRAWREFVREYAFDSVLAADLRLRPDSTAAINPPVLVIDIDRRSLDALGPWPWPRDTMARLTEAVAAAKPAAIAIDILYAGEDTRSPAALARQLAALIDHPELAALADSLPDADKRFAIVIKNQPAVLGAVLDSERRDPLPRVPVLARGQVQIGDIWRVGGVIGPPPQLAAAAAGIGTLALAGDSDGIVRRVPLLVAIGDELYPGLAVEVVRVARGATNLFLLSEPQMLAIGDVRIALSRDAFLRLASVDHKLREARTMSAIDVVDGKADTTRLAGAIALIGGSAPELGGLRQTADDPLAPSIQVQADAVNQILSGRAPHPISDPIQIALTVATSTGALLAATLLAPIVGSALVISAIVFAWAASVALSVRADFLLDPLTPSLGAVIVFAAISIVSYSTTRRLQARITRRFEQHLAPAIVRRIVEDPNLVKLVGEKRDVTTLITDIEGFTAMTRRAAPEALVAALDSYIEGIAAIVMAHGGMVDKIVGDGARALFNVPVDLDDHPRRAIECAIALRAWTSAYRTRATPASIGFGRTRIGIETGPAIVGDIGIGNKLDYTAHGDAVNMAARLEAANKDLGSTICVGPVAASHCDAAMLRPLGMISVPGRTDRPAVFEPWPTETTPAWRQRYLMAFEMMENDPARAVALFEQLAIECPHDPVPSFMARTRCGR